MGDGAIDDAHWLEHLFGTLTGFLDGISHFVGLAEAQADLAELVARDNEGGEAEAPTALDDLGAAIDEDNLFGNFVAIRIGWSGTFFAPWTTATAALAATLTATAALAAAALAATSAATIVALGWCCGSRRHRGNGSSGFVTWFRMSYHDGMGVRIEVRRRVRHRLGL